jgi:hypothetical protein
MKNNIKHTLTTVSPFGGQGADININSTTYSIRSFSPFGGQGADMNTNSTTYSIRSFPPFASLYFHCFQWNRRIFDLGDRGLLLFKEHFVNVLGY